MQLNKSIKKLTASGVCLALAMVFPLLTGQIPQIGRALGPMHIPILLCGFIAGPFYAAVIGLVAPTLRFMLFGAPPFIPTGAAMTFELATYGLVAGLLYKALPQKTSSIYLSLIAAMLSGRMVWGVARVLLVGLAGVPFSFELFIAGAFLDAIPGIILHIILIPMIVMALKNANVLSKFAT